MKVERRGYCNNLGLRKSEKERRKGRRGELKRMFRKREVEKIKGKKLKEERVYGCC